MAYSTTGLPVIPYTLTTVIDGIKYETHVLTNTCQVITEDGVTLCDVLKGLVTSEELNNAIEGIKPKLYVLLSKSNKKAGAIIAIVITIRIINVV